MKNLSKITMLPLVENNNYPEAYPIVILDTNVRINEEVIVNNNEKAIVTDVCPINEYQKHLDFKNGGEFYTVFFTTESGTKSNIVVSIP